MGLFFCQFIVKVVHGKQIQIMDATNNLEYTFQKAPKHTNWRTRHFFEGKIPYGVESFSAGWFGQAHYVWFGYICMSYILILYLGTRV